MISLTVTNGFKTDEAYIYLHREEYGDGGEHFHCDPSIFPEWILLDFDSEGRLFGVEHLAAQNHLPEELLAKSANDGYKRQVQVEVIYDRNSGIATFWLTRSVNRDQVVKLRCKFMCHDTRVDLILDAERVLVGFEVPDASSRLPAKLFAEVVSVTQTPNEPN